MTLKNIPKKVQILEKCDPSSEDEFQNLISIYEKGGKPIDEEMKAMNPNAKENIPFISMGTPIKVDDNKYKMRNQETYGKWIYCGNMWYVRKTDEYEFARYLTYNTTNKTVEGLWDQRQQN